ncbi:LAMI_0H12244g1_1 [Lachancea mirantina]|uniref:LAMI_0H12244g1_1 n=1 Tax=Lachancea mirantina TaxID=1230905 RepID=A0A1G4KHD5_9SACH|nr:LAMI_0H12244g1_1 [Lachancea mirantina]
MRMSRVNLPEIANPKLFSPQIYDRYPLKYEEQIKILQKERLHLEELVYDIDNAQILQYMDSNGEIDIKRKLLGEYALYRAKSSTQETDFVEQLIRWQLDLSKSRSQDFTSREKQQRMVYETLLSVLGSQAFEEVVARQSDDSSNVHNTFQTNDPSHSISRIDSSHAQVDEVTSYLLSSALQKGIDLKPESQRHSGDQNDVSFLKECIDSILEGYSSGNNNQGKTLDDEKSSSELELALKDLRLAHSYLTRRFENDRNEHLRSIDQLTKTNEELSHELLAFHSKFRNIQTKYSELQKETTQLEEKLRLNSLTSLSSPEADASSLNSVGSNGGRPQSLAIMRKEFKKVLSETQRKYETELREERELRRSLERELASQQQ